MLEDDYICAQLTGGSKVTHIISHYPSASTTSWWIVAVDVCTNPCEHTHTNRYRRFVVSTCVHQSAILCVDVKQGGREIGRSSLVAGKWGDLFFGSFPVKFPGDQDTENIYLYTRYVLHKRDGEPERERERGREGVRKHMKTHVCLGEIKREREGGRLNVTVLVGYQSF